jgi:hypothetical protein
MRHAAGAERPRCSLCATPIWQGDPLVRAQQVKSLLPRLKKAVRSADPSTQRRVTVTQSEATGHVFARRDAPCANAVQVVFVLLKNASSDSNVSLHFEKH